MFCRTACSLFLTPPPTIAKGKSVLDFRTNFPPLYIPPSGLSTREPISNVTPPETSRRPISSRNVRADGKASFVQNQSEWKCGILPAGATYPLDVLITHHLTVANVFPTVGPLMGFLQRLFSFLGQSSMESRQQWLSRLKSELSNSPLVSNVAFGFILMGLEKLVELEFECPCNPTWNRLFSAAFFIIPAVMAFTLMLIIQGCRCDAWCRKTLSNCVPAVVWLILLFLDGQYFACAMTDWEGRFVLVDKAAPQKWCEPISEGDVTSQELMLRSQQLFVFSQVSTAVCDDSAQTSPN